jgi:hypothetical protein
METNSEFDISNVNYFEHDFEWFYFSTWFSCFLFVASHLLKMWIFI